MNRVEQFDKLNEILHEIGLDDHTAFEVIKDIKCKSGSIFINRLNSIVGEHQPTNTSELDKFNSDISLGSFILYIKDLGFDVKITAVPTDCSKVKDPIEGYL